MAGEFVEADGNRLAEVHGFLHGMGGDVEDGRAVGEVVVGEAAFFRAKDDGETAGGEADGQFPAQMWERNDGPDGLAALDGGSAEDEGAVGDSSGQRGVFASGGEDG